MVNVTIYSSTMDPMGYGNHMCFPWFMLVYRSVPNHPTVFGDIFLGPFCQSLSLSPKSPIFFTKASGRHLLPSALHHHLAGSQKLSGPLFFCGRRRCSWSGNHHFSAAKFAGPRFSDSAHVSGQTTFSALVWVRFFYKSRDIITPKHILW